MDLPEIVVEVANAFAIPVIGSLESGSQLRCGSTYQWIFMKSILQVEHALRKSDSHGRPLGAFVMAGEPRRTPEFFNGSMYCFQSSAALAAVRLDWLAKSGSLKP